MRKIVFVAITLLAIITGCQKQHFPAGEFRPINKITNWAYQLQNAEPEEIANSVFNSLLLIILMIAQQVMNIVQSRFHY